MELAELSESEELPLPLEDEDDEDEEEEEVVLEPEVLPLSLGLGGIVRFLKLNLLSRIFHFGNFTGLTETGNYHLENSEQYLVWRV